LAKITLGAVVNTVSGSVGSVTFSTVPSTAVLKAKVVSNKSKTAAQVLHRKLWAASAACWKACSGDVRVWWDAANKKAGYSTYNLFMQQVTNGLLQDKGFIFVPTRSTQPGLGGLHLTASGGGTVLVEWSGGGGASSDVVHVAWCQEGGVVWGFDMGTAYTIGSGTYAIMGLKVGVETYVTASCRDAANTVGFTAVQSVAIVAL